MGGGGQQVVIVSGLSGAGKTTVLKALEDMGFYCIDNLPAALLTEFAPRIQADPALYGKVAMGIDARAPGLGPGEIPALLSDLRDSGLDGKLLFLQADDETLVKRFSATRRRHPLVDEEGDLLSSIARERELLEPVRRAADHELDTSPINIHQLRHLTWQCVGPDSIGMSLVLQSFGFSHGVPSDADYLFDVRILPNPHWNPELRALSGRDREVVQWLEREQVVADLATDVLEFLQTWLPELERSHRSMVTVAVGCTGGRHRSVYLVERLGAALRDAFPGLMVHHRDLDS